MRIFAAFFGSILVLSFLSGIFGVGLDSAFKKGVIDINENKPLSIAILFFVSWSLVQILFFKHVAREYIGGIIVGLGIAFLLTSVLGLSIMMYASSFITADKTVQGQSANNS